MITSLIDQYNLREKVIPRPQGSPQYGEIFFCGPLAKGLQSIEGFKGKKILNISGGVRKTFVFEDFSQTENTVSALHDPQFDRVQFQDKQLLPIEQIITSLQGDEKILAIESGKTHNLLLTNKGKVYSFGYGQYGALGLGGSIFEEKPRLIRKLQNRTIVSISCGLYHTLALGHFGDAYSWGRGFEGQLGIMQQIQAASSPQLILSFYKYQKGEVSKLVKKPIIQIACGAYHSCAIDINNQLYCWGEARYGQTGTGKKIKEAMPVHIQITKNKEPQEVKSVSGGFGHTLCLTTSGDLYSWGLNVKGQLGLGDQAESSNNTQIKTIRAKHFPTPILRDMSDELLPKFEKIACGFNRSFAIDQSGILWAWGGGNLGFKDSESQRAPRKMLQNVDQRKFTSIYANQDSLTAFAIQTLTKFLPSSTPSSGGTQLTFFGTGLTDTGVQKIKFIINKSQLIVDANYDGGSPTPTYYCNTPDIQTLLPESKHKILHAHVELSMDGIKYLPYSNTLTVYPSELCANSIEPKSGSTTGRSQLRLNIELPEQILKATSHITVGFQPIKTDKTKKIEYWTCVEGNYEKGEIVCKIPKIDKFDASSPLYNVDLSLNGQQFTGKPNTFRFYQLTNLNATPVQGLPEGGYPMHITASGLFDSNRAKVKFVGEINHKGEKLDLGREIEILNWEKAERRFTFNIPPITWFLGHNTATNQLLADVKSIHFKVLLTLSGLEWIQVSQFKFVDPPPPPPEPEEEKKDSKKDNKKGAKK